MTPPKVTIFAVLAVLFLILNPTIATIECGGALVKILPCEPFLVGFGPAFPSEQCCAGAQELDKIAAASKPDFQGLCECFKQAATQFPINFEHANQLPKICNLSLNITISPDIDCTKL